MKSSKANSGRPASPDVDRAIAGVIAATRRVKRKPDLLQIAEWIEIARSAYGSLKVVGEEVGLSDEMLRQFATVRRLVPAVKELIRRREIESVDMAHRLSKLSEADQEATACAIAAGRVNSEDVRAIVALRRASPHLSPEKIISRVVDSRDIREYIIEFPKPKTPRELRGIRERFGAVVGDDSIRWARIERGKGLLAVDSRGRRRLLKKAKAMGVTTREYVTATVKQETT